MTKLIADTTDQQPQPTSTIAGITLDIDPLGGGHCVLVTRLSGHLTVRLWVSECERHDFARVVAELRGVKSDT